MNNMEEKTTSRKTHFKKANKMRQNTDRFKKFVGNRAEGQGFADKRKKKVQHEYLRMMSKERKKAQHTQQGSNSNQRFSSSPDYKQTNYKRKWESAADNRFGSKRQFTEESDSSRLGATSTQNMEEGEPVGDLRFNRHIPEESFSRSQDGRKGFRKKHNKDPSERNDNIFSKAMDEANARRKEAKHKREQKQKEREERQRALEQYRKKKKDNYFKFHCKKTNKGQPVMKYQMEFLLQKIMERREKDKK